MSHVINFSMPYFSENNIRYVFLDGRACKRIDDCYATLRTQLSLPNYFGNNLDAFEEVLSDLDWISEAKVKIIILNAFELLANEADKKESFFDILNSIENEKLEIIYLGEGGNT